MSINPVCVFFVVTTFSLGQQVNLLRAEKNIISDVDKNFAKHSPLNGKHLRLIATPILGVIDLTRNSSGHVVSSAGLIPDALEWLSLCFNFSFSYVPYNGTVYIEDLPNRRGGLSYLRSKEAEMIVGAMIPTPERFIDCDFTIPWLESPLSTLIPVTNSSISVAALIYPMRSEVWIAVLLTIPVMAVVLYALNQYIKRTNPKILHIKSYDHQQTILFAFDYVVGVFLSQGRYIKRKNLALRLGAAAWCLGSFVLIQAYSSTLISFITTPNRKPIVNSIYDIPNVPGLKITVFKNFAVDVLIMKANESIFKILRKSLTDDPSLRCDVTEDCINKVRSGDHVYVHAEHVIKRIIAMERENTGVCHFTRARETFWAGNGVFGLQKKSLYTESMSQGILKLKASGLFDIWNRYFNREPTECLTIYGKRIKPEILRLTNKNLTGAYLILIIGCIISAVTFFTEIIVYRFLKLSAYGGTFRSSGASKTRIHYP